MKRAVPLFSLVIGCTANPVAPEDAGGGGGGSSSGGGLRRDAGMDAGAVVPDAGVTTDAGVRPDGAMGNPDAGEGCTFSFRGDDNKTRTLLVSQAYAADGGRGSTIRSFTVSGDGTVVDDGMTLDLVERVARIEFVPSGELALAVSEDGLLHSVRVDGTSLSTVDSVQLPSAGYGEIHVTDDGRHAFVLGLNVAETSGISHIDIACDGTISVVTENFLNIRLAESMARIGSTNRYLLLGGQAVFDPMDPLDTRLVQWDGARLSQVGAADLWMDIVNCGRIAVSPDGLTGVVCNGSPFSDDGNQLSIVNFNGNMITQTDRITDVAGPSEILFSTGGSIALITLPEDNRVSVWKNTGTSLDPVEAIAGIGLCDQMVMVKRGALQNHVYVPAIDTSGISNIQRIRIDEGTGATDLGQLDLGDGLEHIPQAVAVTP